MMQCQMTLMMGGENNIDESGNANNIDAVNENIMQTEVKVMLVVIHMMMVRLKKMMLP